MRGAVRIPSPPPIPSAIAPSERAAFGASPHATPSLLRTQVGLGVVRLDANNRPVMTEAQAQRTRFVVSSGQVPGQLVLTAITGATKLAPDALIVSLAADGDVDERRLARVIVGLE